jgi:hypothetical protein
VAAAGEPQEIAIKQDCVRGDRVRGARSVPAVPWETKVKFHIRKMFAVVGIGLFGDPVPSQRHFSKENGHYKVITCPKP